ncbi:MAG: hypothetical protein SV375_18380, partial [Thermodesulfobacteriota bacterium]|nr:hypothetical protein [Thermodesulfobacteriota bacterium]
LTGADLKKYGLEGLNVDPLGISLSLSYADYEGDKQSTGGERLCLKKDRKMIPVTPWMPNTYVPPHVDSSPQWIKDVAKKVAEQRKKKK